MISFLKLVALSLAPVLLVVLAALVLSPGRRWLRTIGVVAVLLLGLAATPLVSGLWLSWLEPWGPVDLAQPGARRAQAVVVLAAEQRPRAEFGGFGPGPLSLERLRYGAYLAKRTGLPVLISGGDAGREGVVLADTLSTALAESFGVRARWLERRSMDTVGNARLSARILRGQGVSRVLLVTHAWHMPRARLAFEQAGLEATPAPTAAAGDPMRRLRGPGDWARALIPQASGLQTSYYAAHETVGLAVLKLTSGRADRSS